MAAERRFTVCRGPARIAENDEHVAGRHGAAEHERGHVAVAVAIKVAAHDRADAVGAVADAADGARDG
jgi:hypothetical protein